MPPSEQTPNVHPAVVLDAKAGFSALIENNDFTAETLFDYLASHDYLTLKALVELSQRYGI